MAISCCCNLGETCISPVMSGRGPIGAEYMIVGEAPGGTEDITGEPFVGKAGKMLNGMLQDAGINPSNCYFTNAVRCRPPQNATPTTEQIDACRPNLKQEIEFVKPQCIIALGAVALQSLCKLAGIGSKRGNDFPLHSDFGLGPDAPRVFPTYHPSFVCRPQGQWARPTVVADLRKVRDRLKSEDDVEWHWQDKFENKGIVLRTRYTGELSMLYPETLAWDIETDYDKGIPGSGKKIIQMATTDSGGTTVWLDNIPVGLCGGNLVTHNGWNFDVPIHGGADWGRDTMVMAYLDDENQPLGLEPLAVKYCGAHGWKESHDAPLGSDEYAGYNARDSYWTYRLDEVLRERLGPRLKIAQKIMLPAHIALRETSERGIWIDRVACIGFIDQKKMELEDARKECGMFMGDGNPNSWQQILKAFARIGLNPPSTSEATLQRMKHPFAEAILKWRDCTRALSTLQNYFEMERCHYTYKLWRSAFDPGGTVTGRSSARHHNLDRRFKEIFSAPPGKVLISGDYAGIEFRLAAWYANEEGILQRFQENPEWDAHTHVARILYAKDDVNPDERQIAKSANFSQLYKGDGHTLQEYMARMGVMLPYRECARISNVWHNEFPGFDAWYADVEQRMRKLGYSESATGRRRHTLRLTEAVNAPVQNLAWDLMAVSLAQMHDEQLPTVWQVHDSVSVEVEDCPAVIAKTKATMKEIMTIKAPQFLKTEFGVDLSNIPLAVDFKELRCR